MPGKPGIPQTPASIARYILSVPERVLRSVSALAAGLVREIGDAALPAPIRRTHLYHTLVGRTLRFLIEEVGEVEGAYPAEGKIARDFLLRKAAGDGIDLVGILAFSASPFWILAALADLSGAGRQLVREIAESLKEEKLLQREGTFETVEQMLNGLEQSAGRIAETINLPPLDVPELRREWNAITQQIGAIPPRSLPPVEFLARVWDRIENQAAAENRTVFEVSSLMALSAFTHLPDRLVRLSRAAQVVVERTGQFFAEPLLDHYAAALDEIALTGFLEYWTRQSRPYLRAAASQFSPQRNSLTARLLKGAGAGHDAPQ